MTNPSREKELVDTFVELADTSLNLFSDRSGPLSHEDATVARGLAAAALRPQAPATPWRALGRRPGICRHAAHRS